MGDYESDYNSQSEERTIPRGANKNSSKNKPTASSTGNVGDQVVIGFILVLSTELIT